MTDFTMFSRKSDIIFYEERFNLFALYGRLSKASLFDEKHNRTRLLCPPVTKNHDDFNY